MKVQTIRNLQNKKVQILDAVTQTNTISKSSRITNSIIDLKSIIHERSDLIFFENIEIDGKPFRPSIYTNESNCIHLQPMNMRAKDIKIKDFKIIN